MKNMRIKILIFTLIFLSAISFFIYKPFIFRENIKEITKASEVETHEYFKNKVQQYEVVKCEYGLNNIEHIFVYEEKFEERLYYGIEHYNLKRNSIFAQNFIADYTGGTTIKNTTFPKLVEMVKEDCSQFQRAEGDPSDKTINWSYSPYTPEPKKEPEPELTDEEAAARRQQAMDQYNMVKKLREQAE